MKILDGKSKHQHLNIKIWIKKPHLDEDSIKCK
jgi:hypothetical protein